MGLTPNVDTKGTPTSAAETTRHTAESQWLLEASSETAAPARRQRHVLARHLSTPNHITLIELCCESDSPLGQDHAEAEGCDLFASPTPKTSQPPRACNWPWEVFARTGARSHGCTCRALAVPFCKRLTLTIQGQRGA